MSTDDMPETPKALIALAEDDVVAAMRELSIARRTLLLVEAYFDCGRMAVMLPDGRKWEDAPDVRVEQPAYKMQNVHAKARAMAEAGEG